MTEDKKRHRHGSRFRARRRAVDILFEAEFRDTDPVEVVEQRRELSLDPESQVSPIADYTASIVLGVATALDEIDDTLAAHLSSEWTLERLPAVDRAILRVSAWELLHNHENVPDKVAVDEGIGLAKEYGHDKAPVYVHAVLDSISRDRRRADEDARAAAALAEAAQAEAVLDESSATGVGQSGDVADDLIASIVTDDAADDSKAPQATEVTHSGEDSPKELGNGVARDATAE